jgi:hypothetical protein
MLVAAVPLHAGAARADDKAVREAQARFEEGLKRVKAGDFEAARMSFVQAYVVLRKPDILWNLALSEEKSARPLDALAHFKEFARQAPTDADHARAQKHLDALVAQTGHIEVQAPAGTPLVLDGATSVGTAPLADTVDVAPGHHVIEGKLAEGTKAQSVDAVAGEITRVNFIVAGSDRPSPPSAVASMSTAEGSASAAAPPTGAPVASASVGEDSRGGPPAAKLATTTALGAGAVIAIGLGVYFGLQSRSDANTAAAYRAKDPSDYCVNPGNPGCAQWNGAVQAQNRDATASNVLYVTGAVLAVGALASWFFWPRGSETRSSAVWVVPAAGPSGGGVTAGGRF